MCWTGFSPSFALANESLLLPDPAGPFPLGTGNRSSPDPDRTEVSHPGPALRAFPTSQRGQGHTHGSQLPQPARHCRRGGQKRRGSHGLEGSRLRLCRARHRHLPPAAGKPEAAGVPLSAAAGLGEPPGFSQHRRQGLCRPTPPAPHPPRHLRFPHRHQSGQIQDHSFGRCAVGLPGLAQAPPRTGRLFRHQHQLPQHARVTGPGSTRRPAPASLFPAGVQPRFLRPQASAPKNLPGYGGPLLPRYHRHHPGI